MRKSKIISNSIFILTFYIVIVALAYATNKLVVDDNELLLIKKNGIIAGMCYVTEILTGNFAKSVMAMFIMATGWSFITAGKVEWKTLLNITIATSLLFGGASIAHLISGNNYSCKSFKYIQERQDGVIENAGYCLLRDIPEYQTSQVWNKCNKNGEYCEEKVNIDVDVLENDIVNLSMCEDGAFRENESDELKYRCIKKENGTYEFVKFRGEKFCVKYCNVDSLRSFFNNNDNYRPVNSAGSLLAIGNKPYLISGKTIKNDTAYLSGALLDIVCNENCSELDENGEQLTQEAIKPRGVKLKCDDGVYRIVDGRCEKNCTISTLASYGNVLSWQNCPKIDSSTEDCFFLYSASNSNRQLKSNSVIKIEECKDGYSIQNTEKKANFKCTDGLWIKTGVVAGESNTFCEKGCDKKNIPNFELINNLVLFKGNQNIDITSRNIFYENELLLLKSCLDKSRFLTKESREATSKALSTAQFSCRIDGSWENVNYGEYCHKDCFLDSSFQELNINTWEILDRNKKAYTYSDTKNIKNTSSLLLRTIYNKEYLRGMSCNSNYGVKNEATMPIFLCKDGAFTRDSGIAKPCRRICDLSTIPVEYKNVALWNYCDDTINTCYKDFNDKTVVFEDDFISTMSCKEGSDFGNANRIATILKCDSDGSWSIKRSGDNCFANE